MVPHQLKINKDTLNILSDVIKYTKPYWQGFTSERIITREEFLNTPVPSKHVDLLDYQCTKSFYPLLLKQQGELVPDHHLEDMMRDAACSLDASEITNGMIYAPMSSMDWHTDTYKPGIRIYYTFSLGESIFRYVDDGGNIVTTVDSSGWTARTFEVTDQSNPLWHTVWTEKSRFSFGFKL